MRTGRNGRSGRGGGVGDRKRPEGTSGVLAALLIAPRTFCYCVCSRCLRELFYTYPGESCPFCDAPVYFVEGVLPAGAGRPEINLRGAARASHNVIGG